MSSTADWRVHDSLDWLHGVYFAACEDQHNEVASRRNGRCATDRWCTSDTRRLASFHRLTGFTKSGVDAMSRTFMTELVSADGLAGGPDWTGLTDPSVTRHQPASLQIHFCSPVDLSTILIR